LGEDKEIRQRIGKLYEEGLDWVLEELAEKHVAHIPGGHHLLKVDDRKLAQAAKDKASRRERARRAMEREKARMQKMRNSFATSDDWMQAVEVDDDALAEDDGTSMESGAKACIVCHERTGQPVGYIGFAQRSTVLAQAVDQATRNEVMQKRYLVVDDVVVRASPDEHAPTVGQLHVGVEVVVEEKKGQLARISSPLAGWVMVGMTGGKSSLLQEKEFAWQAWGRPRVLVTFCGHGVHQDCWDSYYATTQQVGGCLL